MIKSIGAPFVLAFALSLAVVPLCRTIATRLGFVARPREDRWHRGTVALFGGVGIFAVLFLCSALFGIVRAQPVLVVTAALMFGAGLVDDVLSIKPATKLIAQLALACVLLFFDYRLNWLQSTTLDSLLTLVWIVGLTNAFNLLDNMDGLCAGIAIIVGTALMIDLLPGAAGTRAFAEAQYLAIVLGATGGFLVYNLHPASIFMGDSGSLLLGFSFAAVTLSSGRQVPGRSDILSIVAVPALVLLIPIFDTTLVTLSRWVSGRRASEGGRDHSSHRLVAIGLSERRAVALLWFLAAVGGSLGVAIDYFKQSYSAMAAALAFLISMILFAAYLGGIRVYDDTDSRVKQGAFTPIVVEFMYKRRVAEVFLDFCLVALCYYTAYRLRFEDPRRVHEELRDVPRIATGDSRVTDDGLLRRRGVPRRLAPFRNDGFARHRAWCSVWHDWRPGLHSVRLSLLCVLQDRIRNLWRPSAHGRDAGAGVVPNRWRICAAPAPVRATCRDLRRGRCGWPGHPRGAFWRRRCTNPRFHRRRSAQGRHPRDGLLGTRGLFSAERPDPGRRRSTR
jgi:UDP-N-acetylmuramyl pentapeptide phosphotransferase/UDP-N-acetylglucosamine-1-phosphate transferase